MQFNWLERKSERIDSPLRAINFLSIPLPGEAARGPCSLFFLGVVAQWFTSSFPVSDSLSLALTSAPERFSNLLACLLASAIP